MADDPALEPRLGDGPEHLAACHRPMAEGENLADFKPTVDAEERVIEPEGVLAEGALPGAGDDSIGALPTSREGGQA